MSIAFSSCRGRVSSHLVSVIEPAFSFGCALENLAQFAGASCSRRGLSLVAQGTSTTRSSSFRFISTVTVSPALSRAPSRHSAAGLKGAIRSARPPGYRKEVSRLPIRCFPCRPHFELYHPFHNVVAERVALSIECVAWRLPKAKPYESYSSLRNGGLPG